MEISPENRTRLEYIKKHVDAMLDGSLTEHEDMNDTVFFFYCIRIRSEEGNSGTCGWGNLIEIVEQMLSHLQQNGVAFTMDAPIPDPETTTLN